MEKSARMDNADFGSLPPLKSNDVKVTGVFAYGITYIDHTEPKIVHVFFSFFNFQSWIWMQQAMVSILYCTPVVFWRTYAA